MGINKNIEQSKQTTNQAIHKVIQSQRSLAITHRHLDLMKYLERPSWRIAARKLTEDFWPRTVRDDLYVGKVIERLYQVAMVLVPLAGQCPGFWMPWRHNGHLACWLKQYTFKRYGKRMLTVKKWNWDEAPSRLAENAAALGILDRDFINLCSELITANAYASSARGDMVRKFLAPLVFNVEAKRMYRHARQNQGVTWWDEKAVFVLSKTKIFHNQESCIDLQKRTATLWNYTVKVKSNSLGMLLSDAFLKQIKADITDTLRSSVGPQRKIDAISTKLETVHRWAKHCPEAGLQRKALGKWVMQIVGEELLKDNPKLADSLFDIASAPWDPEFYPRGQSGLLDKSLKLENWLKWWGPRR